MKSNMRQKLQDGVDGIHELIDGCRLAMLIDQNTGLVLSTNSKATISQDERDRLASRARADLVFATAKTISDDGKAGDTISVTCLEANGDEITAIRDLAISDVAVVCRFDRTPSSADLKEAAAEVFSLFAIEEAA